MSKFPLLFLATALFAFASPPLQAEEYPDATATDNPNVVVSPFPPNKKIDVTGFLPGDLARDPHTNKIFRVPARRATPLIVKPEIIEDDLPILRPEIVEEPETVRKPIPVTPTIPSVAGTNPPTVTPGTPEPVAPKPVIPARAPRQIDSKLTDFVKVFVRAGQNDDTSVQGQYLAPTLSNYYSLRDTPRDQVIADRESFVSRWPRRIYVASGKPRFVRWISNEDAEDEFVVDIRVYQSLKSSSGNTKRGYADHRLSIHEKADGTFEITGAEERRPRSILAGQ